VPEGVTRAALSSALEALANELMVDIALDEAASNSRKPSASG
jgi:hypothetical protein